MTDEKHDDGPDEVEVAAIQAEALTHDEPEPPEPSARVNRVVLGVAGALVAAVVVVLVLVLFVFGSSTPSEVVDDYFQAVKDGDVDALEGLLCGDSVENVLGDPESREQFGAELAAIAEGLEWRVTGEVITGDTATVTVEMSGLGVDDGSGDAPIDIGLVKDAGEWKVCDAPVA